MVMVAVPCVVHVTPSGETDAVNVLPTRCTRTQYGAAIPAVVVATVVPAVAVLRWNETPLAAETRQNACAEFAASDSRIITPAFAHTSVFSTTVTRATIVQSPLASW